MIKIKFKKMQILEDERTVKVAGEYKYEPAFQLKNHPHYCSRVLITIIIHR